MVERESGRVLELGHSDVAQGLLTSAASGLVPCDLLGLRDPWLRLHDVRVPG
jgi:hypothetical protein